MKSARDAVNTTTEVGIQVVKTYGEVLPDGSVLDLVLSATGELILICSDRNSIRIDTQIEHDGRIYQVKELPGSILRATRLAQEPAGYGSIRELFTDLRDAFERYLGFSTSLAEAATFWVLTTWFCDCLPNPPILWATGADDDLAMDFLKLLHCLVRRGLRLTGVTRSGFQSLPFAFNPVLLVNQPGLPVKLQSLFCESNSRGSVILGNRGTALDVTSSKAVFLGMSEIPPRLNSGNFYIALLPADPEAPHLDDRTLNAIADHFQPRLLQYRLDHAKQVRESQFVIRNLPSPARELARQVGACIQGDADLALQVVPLLRSQDDLVNRCSLDFAIIQVLLPRLHSSTAGASAATMKIEAELTAEVNTYMLSCGENRQYSREEVGLRVALLELSRKKTNAGRLLLLDRQTSRRVHQLARGYGIDKSMPECSDCQRTEPLME